MPAAKPKIFVFGAESGKDSIAAEAARRLEAEFAGKAEFVYASDLAAKEFSEREFIGIDAASGIRKVELLDNLDRISAGLGLSAHGFDLGFQLKLLQKAGKINSAKIIAIPLGHNIENAVSETRELLKSILP